MFNVNFANVNICTFFRPFLISTHTEIMLAIANYVTQ